MCQTSHSGNPFIAPLVTLVSVMSNLDNGSVCRYLAIHTTVSHFRLTLNSHNYIMFLALVCT